MPITDVDSAYFETESVCNVFSISPSPSVDSGAPRYYAYSFSERTGTTLKSSDLQNEERIVSLDASVANRSTSSQW